MDVIREFQTYYDGGYRESLPGEFTEKYETLECLSHTGECDTLLVKQRDTGRKAVAKCYAQSSPRYEMEEPQQLKTMKNGVIPQYIGEYKNEQYRCVLREYIEGISLEKYVRTHPLSQDVLTELAIGLASAMKTLHDAEPAIIHRDIKPENIIIKEDGTVALIDLGISRVFKKRRMWTHFSAVRKILRRRSSTGSCRRMSARISILLGSYCPGCSPGRRNRSQSPGQSWSG